MPASIYPKKNLRVESQYPDDHSLASDVEQFTAAAAERYAADVLSLRKATMGRDGRPYQHQPVGPNDLDDLYEMLRKKADPASWASVLSSGEPADILNWMRTAEQKYAARQRGEVPE